MSETSKKGREKPKSNPLESLAERWLELSEKLRWRAQSSRVNGDSQGSTMNDTTSKCLEMCSIQLQDSMNDVVDMKRERLKKSTKIKTILPNDLLNQLEFLENEIDKLKEILTDLSTPPVNYVSKDDETEILVCIETIADFRFFQ